MQLIAPVSSYVTLELALDEQHEPIVKVLTRGNELVTAIYLQNLLKYTGDLLLDSSNHIALAADTVEVIKDQLKHLKAKLDKEEV